MQLGKVRNADGTAGVVLVDRQSVFRLDLARDPQVRTLADLLHSPDPLAAAQKLIDAKATSELLPTQTFVAPIDRQEVWAAGVTYKRSKVAREGESKGAAQFYDKVYSAPRPELFLKATPARVINPGAPVRIREDATWSVPEPELTLVISPAGKIVGFTVGNDMSSRDIEGENPLYLPQAKIYKGSAAVGPLVTLAGAMPPLPEVEIRLVIRRGGKSAFEGATTLSQMARTVESLAEWLYKENEFPEGAFLMTGTGIVPPDDFTLARGDVVSITIAGIGTLTNPVA
jgi:2-dehydro-3-deoxy-D-arabinonate dehydratase